MIATYVLIIALAASGNANTGAAAISQEFTSEVNCKIAGAALAENAYKRGNYVLTWGCFKK